jgi:hypothetical protein
MGWLDFNSKTKPIERTISEEFQTQQGIEIGQKARLLFPKIVLVSDKSIIKANSNSTALLSDKTIKAIAESTFLIENGLVAKADIIKKIKVGLHLFEVKSAININSDLIDDLSYTAMVMKCSGYSPKKCSLLLISDKFRKGKPINELFTEKDCTIQVLLRSNQFLAQKTSIISLNSKTVPAPQLTIACRNCNYAEQCVCKGVEHHIFDLPRLSKSKLLLLASNKISCINDIPKAFELTDMQKRVRQCVQKNSCYVGQNLRNDFDKIITPIYYLDFETAATTLPLYDHVAPYEPIPSQYSIHILFNSDSEPQHKEYLASHKNDCRKEFAENLIKDIGKTGSVMVYSGYEQRIISSLAQLFPELSSALRKILPRLVDLKKIIENNYYHPDFHGSFSIKKTLPALVPEMSYDGLAIRKGDDASALFAMMVLGKIEGNKLTEVRNNLLKYCEQDTFAMVKLHQALLKFKP